ncbi:MAG: hypothetical protein P8X65_07735 [Syntrophobacterales bacterium]|jgi:hypothetical protein
MSMERRWLGILLVVLLVLGGSGWVFNPSQKPGRGLVWTRWQTQKKQAREEAVARHNYCPSGGCVIRLEDVKINRTKAVPGDTLTLTTTYTILTPENVPIPLTISRELLHDGKSLGRVQAINSNNKNGTYVQNIDFTLPVDAALGAYTVVTRVNTGYGMDEKSLKFTVY